MKIKALVAAVALAATGTVNAAITSVDGIHGGDLFVSILNPGAMPAEDQSFHLNLNMLASSLDGSASYSWDLNALSGGAYASLLGETDVRFTVAGGNNDFNDVGTSYGNYLTGQVSPASINGLGDVQTVNGIIDNQAVLLNSAASQGDYALVNRGDQGFYAGTGTFVWGDTVAGINMSANVGDSIGFYFISPTSLTDSLVTEYAGVWSLSTDGMLSYSAVPVPAAVWLFGSGLVGLIGVARRRK